MAVAPWKRPLTPRRDDRRLWVDSGSSSSSLVRPSAPAHGVACRFHLRGERGRGILIRSPLNGKCQGMGLINSVLSRHCCAGRRGSQARVPITCAYLIASPSPESESNMPRPRQSITPAARTHLLCYLVTSALASHALTKTWRVEHIVESARIWLARNMMSASWLDRLMLGQMALKLSREHLSASRAVRQSDVLTLFTNELTLNYQSPLVGHIWQMCSDALDAGSLGSGA